MSTRIPYLDEAWSPTSGCSPISPGCDHCWAARMAGRFNRMMCVRCHGTGHEYIDCGNERSGYDLRHLCPDCGGGGDVPDFTPRYHRSRFEQPFHWRKHRRVGVCFMGDLFHPEIANDWLQDEVFAVMEQCPQHDFLVLTKRAYNMRDYIRDRELRQANHPGVWPLPNVWLGVTICNQEEADEKLPVLLDTPAALIWVSYEPALGPVDFSHYLPHWCPDCNTQHSSMTCWRDEAEPKSVMRPRIGWIVVGGETGPGARPMDAEWALAVCWQCRKAGVPFYFKQWGTHKESGRMSRGHLYDFIRVAETRDFPEVRR